MNIYLLLSYCLIGISPELIPAEPLELTKGECLQLEEKSESLAACCDPENRLMVSIREQPPRNEKDAAIYLIGGTLLECQSSTEKQPSISVSLALGQISKGIKCDRGKVLLSDRGIQCEEGNEIGGVRMINAAAELGILMLARSTMIEDLRFYYWYDNGQKSAEFISSNRNLLRFGEFWDREGSPMRAEAWVETYGDVHTSLVYKGFPLPHPKLKVRQLHDRRRQ